MTKFLNKVAIVTIASSTIWICVATTTSANVTESFYTSPIQEFLGEMPPVDESTYEPIIMTYVPIEEIELVNEYIVQAGDTLTKISEEFNLDVPTLMQWNNLFSDFLSIGQVLSVNGQVELTEEQIAAAKAAEEKRKESLAKAKEQQATKAKEQQAAKQKQENTKPKTQVAPSNGQVSSNNGNLISVAQQYLGVPYVYGGKTPSGFDCSGFVSYVLQKVGKLNSYHSSIGLYNISQKVSTPQVGDLVFFSGTYRAGISHVGIYIGNNQMISASGKKVQIANIYNSYWGKHFTGFGRP
jgi:cell wall-associated NlpC family hydrolase